jgi:succinate dehydrogenase / fumarate reductase cytochrome b subunit
MSNFMQSSIGKKFFMSITGLFLMVFLMVHLTVNMFLIFDDTGELFNLGSHFMVTNPVIRIIEPVLAIGFVLHIAYAFFLTLDNMKARPVKYKKVNQKESSTWASRNMIILGLLIGAFLVLHIMNFYWKMRFTGHELLHHVNIDGVEMENSYALVAGLFKNSIAYSIAYMVSAILLGLHLMHGFWSSFQTIGWSNDLWRKRLEFVGKIYAIVIAAGFSIIPLYFIIKF